MLASAVPSETHALTAAPSAPGQRIRYAVPNFGVFGPDTGSGSAGQPPIRRMNLVDADGTTFGYYRATVTPGGEVLEVKQKLP